MTRQRDLQTPSNYYNALINKIWSDRPLSHYMIAREPRKHAVKPRQGSAKHAGQPNSVEKEE